ncbi:MAG: hypothetical protein ACFFFD_00110 [Promethearchaeota archaeon]
MRHVSLSAFAIVLVLAFSTFTYSEKVPAMTFKSHVTSDTDLTRADWTENNIPNGNFERWEFPSDPDGFYTSRSTEHYCWNATDPWPHNEGIYSGGMQARALDDQHPGEAVWQQSTWGIDVDNLTVEFDWFADSMPNPLMDEDYFAVRFRFTEVFSNEKIIWYYFSGSPAASNTSSRLYYIIGGTEHIWNSFYRNVTRDYVDNFGSMELERTLYNLQFYVGHKGSTNQFARAFIDDVRLENGDIEYISASTKNGNFETKTSAADWTPVGGNRDASEISQSTESHSGDWSLNITSSSNGNQSDCSMNKQISTRLTNINRDAFRLSYRIDAVDSLNGEEYAYFYWDCRNDTHDMAIYLVFAAGDLPLWMQNATDTLVLHVEGFNTTTSWMYLDTSLWEIASGYFNASASVLFDLTIFDFSIEFKTTSPGARISILFDDFGLVSAALNDMGYEDQPSVGAKIVAWGSDVYFETSSLFTVTDDAYEGSKAANMTLSSSDYFERSQELEDSYIASDLERYLDVMWRCDSFDSGGYSRATLAVTFWDEKEIVYFFMYNETAVNANTSSEAAFIVESANSIGSWEWAHRDLYHDYVEAFGWTDEVGISSFRLEGDAGSGTGLTFLMDNLYFYSDLAPEITDIMQIPLSPEPNEEVMVFAGVVDAGLSNVTLRYRVDNGAWSSLLMVYVSGLGYRGIIPGESEGVHVDYYVQAFDVYSKNDVSDTFSYDIPESTSTPTTPIDIPPPIDILPLTLGLAIALAAVVFVYFAVVRPRQAGQ